MKKKHRHKSGAPLPVPTDTIPVDPIVPSTSATPEPTSTPAPIKQQPIRKQTMRTWFKPDPFDLALYGFVVAVSCGLIYYLQLSAMGKQLEVMKNDQRPWVAVKEAGPIPPPAANVEMQVWLTFTNYGQTPAFVSEIVTEIRPMVGDFPDTIEFKSGPPPGYEKRHFPMFPGEATGKQMVSITLTPQQAVNLSNSVERLYVFGRILYDDQNHDKHTTRFCYQIGASDAMRQNIVLADCHSPWVYAD